tara:strand:+ start:682 stop:1167 length:486 start_codon:yes stop_codon:yes gene_type:complete
MSTLRVDEIKDSTGASTGLTIDSTGRVLAPAVPAFHAWKSSIQTASASSETVTFDNVTLNTGSHFSSNIFTVPVAGVYFFSCKWLSTNDTDQDDIYIQVNNVSKSKSRNSKSAVGSHDSVTITYIVSLSVSDTVRVVINASGSSIYGGSEGWTTFMGYLIG